jgi:hypothetical protein
VLQTTAPLQNAVRQQVRDRKRLAGRCPNWLYLTGAVVRKLILLTIGVAALITLKKQGRGFGPFSAATVSTAADELMAGIRGGARPKQPGNPKRTLWQRLTGRAARVE